jgi:hypothetical protein
MSYYIRGIIQNSFYIVGTDNENASYFLCMSANLPDTFGFYPVNFPSTVTPTPFFYANSVFSTTAPVNGFNMVQIPDGNIIASTSPGSLLFLRNIDYSGNQMQAGAFYNIVNQSSDTVYFPIVIPPVPPSNVSTKVPAISNVRFVPTTWFGGLVSNASEAPSVCNTFSGSNVIAQEIAWINDPLTYPNTGFTTVSECNNGFFYNYCATNETCGKCFGQCKQGACMINGDQFYCQGQVVPKYYDHQFAVLMIMIALAFLIIIMITAFVT